MLYKASHCKSIIHYWVLRTSSILSSVCLSKISSHNTAYRKTSHDIPESWKNPEMCTSHINKNFQSFKKVNVEMLEFLFSVDSPSQHWSWSLVSSLMFVLVVTWQVEYFIFKSARPTEDMDLILILIFLLRWCHIHMKPGCREMQAFILYLPIPPYLVTICFVTCWGCGIYLTCDCYTFSLTQT